MYKYILIRLYVYSKEYCMDLFTVWTFNHKKNEALSYNSIRSLYY